MHRQISFFGTLATIFCSFSMFSQPVWTADIAPIIFDNCSSCHHDGGIAPFELLTFADCVAWAEEIHHATDEREMPPWPADPDYQHFVGETYLSDEEIQLIHDWVYGGQIEGDLADMPNPPTFPEYGSLLETIDFTIDLPDYTLISNYDEYRWFVIPTDFEEPVYVSKLEVVAGLEEVVHHVDLYIDETGQSQILDDLDPLPGFNGSTGTPVLTYYVNAWQPGGNIAEYPEGWGIEIPPGADLVVEVHFGPDGLGLTDSGTKMNLQFVENPENVRPVQVGWLLYDSPPVLVDGPLVIPANWIVTFHQETAPLQEDLSVISICPHMHYLGKSYKVWYETPEGEEVPLINIPQWDFHWQKYYTFQYVKKIPAGSVIKSEGVYDNTLNNHDNPFNPPQTAYSGPTTLDEMFLCYFIFADYMPGDENILMDSSLIVTTSIEELNKEEDLAFSVFPNPAQDVIHVTGFTSFSDQYEYQILDIKGSVLMKGTLSDNTTIDVSAIPAGTYIIEVEDEKFQGSRKFLKTSDK